MVAQATMYLGYMICKAVGEPLGTDAHRAVESCLYRLHAELSGIKPGNIGKWYHNGKEYKKEHTCVCG